VQILVAEEALAWKRGPNIMSRQGAIRDIVQNHMMQILCLIAMEPPAAYEADAIRDEKVKVLRALRALTPAEVLARVVRGQYSAGTSDGSKVVGYQQEQGIKPQSTTETYVAMNCSSRIGAGLMCLSTCAPANVSLSAVLRSRFSLSACPTSSIPRGNTGTGAQSLDHSHPAR